MKCFFSVSEWLILMKTEDRCRGTVRDRLNL